MTMLMPFREIKSASRATDAGPKCRNGNIDCASRRESYFQPYFVDVYAVGASDIADRALKKSGLPYFMVVSWNGLIVNLSVL